MGCNSSVSSIFKSFPALFISVWHVCQWPVWDLGSGLSSGSLLKSVVCCLGSGPRTYNLRVNPGALGSFFPKQEFSWYLWYFWFPGVPLYGLLARKLGLFIPLCWIFPTTNPMTEIKLWEDGEKKQNRGLPYTFGTTPPLSLKGKFPSLRVLGVCMSLLPYCCCYHCRIVLGSRCNKMEKTKRNRGWVSIL